MKVTSFMMCVLLSAAQAAAADVSGFDGRFHGRFPEVNLSHLTQDIRSVAADMPDAPGVPLARPTYSGSARWTKNNFTGFSVLEGLGVQKGAEKNAVVKCQEEGLLGCAAVAAHITFCDSYACKASAVAKVVQVPQGSVQKTIKGDAKWTKSNLQGFDTLERLGVEKSADQDALARCQGEGLNGCVAIGSQIASCDSYACAATSVAIGFDQAAKP